MVEGFRRLLASNGDNLANLLRREGSRTTRTRPIGQQGADRFPQAFRLFFQRLQSGTALDPTFSPEAHGLLTPAHLLGDGFVGAALAHRQHDLGTLYQAMRDFTAANEGPEELLLFRRQMNRCGRAGHIKIGGRG